MIAEDQVLLREGLGRLFEDAGHEVAASLGDAEALQFAIAEHDPDLVVLDIRMPPTFTDEGARAARETKQAHPELGVLVLSQHIETTHAVELFTMHEKYADVLPLAEILDYIGRVAPPSDVRAELIGARA